MEPGNTPKRELKPIDSTLYDQAYYLEHMEGAGVFTQSHGQQMSRRLEVTFDLAQIQPGEKVLDVACGRGEILLQSARFQAAAFGVDYASVSIQIANSLRRKMAEVDLGFELAQANVRQIPFASNSFDCALATDIVEHLYPPELAETLHEVWRVLRPGGRLIVHTVPNADYYRWGYPLYRFLNRLVGKKLPVNPRDRNYLGEVHVNEQTPRALRKALKEAGFVEPKVWLNAVAGSWLYRQAISFYPWRWVLVNDIFAIAVK